MILPYIYDFISFVFEDKIQEDVRKIILFGSMASGEFDEKSDIDIFIDLWDSGKKNYIEKKIKRNLLKFEEKASRVWYPRGINNKFSILIGNLEAPQWKNLVYDMLSNGIVIYGKFEKMPEKLQHKVIITFSLTNLKQKEKMSLTRKLYGYSTKKNGKIYESESMLKRTNSVKISENSLLIPIEKSKEYKKLFSEYKVTARYIEIWTY